MASVVNTYARAFADVVFSRGLDPAQTQRELQSLADLIAGNKDLRQIWEAPSIPAEQKRKLLDAIVAREKISHEVRNLVAVLIDHRRVRFLPSVAKQVQLELDSRLGFAEAEISSARELSQTERRNLESRVEKLTGRKVRASYSRDESLMGGAVVKLGSTIYDGSVKGQLERIREALSS